jgi:hypothetical protein
VLGHTHDYLTVVDVQSEGVLDVKAASSIGRRKSGSSSGVVTVSKGSKSAHSTAGSLRMTKGGAAVALAAGNA